MRPVSVGVTCPSCLDPSQAPLPPIFPALVSLCLGFLLPLRVPSALPLCLGPSVSPSLSLCLCHPVPSCLSQSSVPILLLLPMSLPPTFPSSLYTMSPSLLRKDPDPLRSHKQLFMENPGTDKRASLPVHPGPEQYTPTASLAHCRPAISSPEGRKTHFLIFRVLSFPFSLFAFTLYKS